MNSKFFQTVRKWIIWIPLLILILNAGFRIIYWEGMRGGHGHAGGGFGPFCSPMFKYVLVTKISVDCKLYIYKGDQGNPIKNLMLPSESIIADIGKKILKEEQFQIKTYPTPFDGFVGEITISEEDLSPKTTFVSTRSGIIIDRKDIQFIQLNLWELNDDSKLIKSSTTYTLRESFVYN